MSTTASVVLKDDSPIEAAVDREISAIPALYIDRVSIQISGRADAVAVADRLIQAVLEWQHEIHQRAAERAEAGR